MKDKVLTIKEIPVDLSNKHPPPPNDILPKHEFTMGIVAPKGAGKTTLICNILDFYRKYFHTIIVFSPSIKNDDKWDWVKDQKLLVENKKLKKVMKKLEKKDQFKNNPIVGELVGKDMEHMPSLDEGDDFDGKIPDEHFHEEFDPDVFDGILEEQNALIVYLKDNGYSKHVANRILFLFDDQVGSNVFTSKRRDPFKMFNCRHRHYSASVIMVAQGYHEIPKTLRTNFSCLIVFEICSEKEVEGVMKEYPMGLKVKQWMEVYNYCTENGEFDFMFYNMQKPKPLRIMKNFNEILTFK